MATRCRRCVGRSSRPINWHRELGRLGHKAGASLVGRTLHYLGYSLQANAKVTEGAQHPDRDGQFRYINDTAAEHLAAGQPVISVDCKKKELVGDYANGGAEWEPEGEPTRVGTHDFPDPDMPKAIPYGVYDIGANEGWVNVGDDHDTPAFAVASIARWWERMGRARYPQATRLMITADAGGSNAYRSRAFKVELARLAATIGLAITVCHMPPGTSKWNKVEHRLFSFISMNWRGKPLTTYRVIVELIAATTTRTGLQRPSRPRHRLLPDRPEGHRQTAQRPPHPSPRLAPRLELHTSPTMTAQVITAWTLSITLSGCRSPWTTPGRTPARSPRTGIHSAVGTTSRRWCRSARIRPTTLKRHGCVSRPASARGRRSVP